MTVQLPALLFGLLAAASGTSNACVFLVAGIFVTGLLVWVTLNIVEVDRMVINSA